MKIIFSNIFSNERIPDENFPDYGIDITVNIIIISVLAVILELLILNSPSYFVHFQCHVSALVRQGVVV